MRAKASGVHLSKKEASLVLGMDARGDRDHDIAAWFGVNSGRVAEVKNGAFGAISAAADCELPPQGPPGLKGRELREQVEKAITQLENSGADPGALDTLRMGLASFNKNDG